MLRVYVDGYFDDQKLMPRGCVTMPELMTREKCEAAGGASVESLGLLKLGRTVLNIRQKGGSGGEGEGKSVDPTAPLVVSVKHDGKEEEHEFDAVVVTSPLRRMQLMVSRHAS
jgi:hypothetical protein